MFGKSEYLLWLPQLEIDINAWKGEENMQKLQWFGLKPGNTLDVLSVILKTHAVFVGVKS